MFLCLHHFLVDLAVCAVLAAASPTELLFMRALVVGAGAAPRLMWLPDESRSGFQMRRFDARACLAFFLLLGFVDRVLKMRMNA